MEYDSIDMEDDLKMTVSTWKMTVSILDILSLWHLALEGGWEGRDVAFAVLRDHCGAHGRAYTLGPLSPQLEPSQLWWL